MTVLPRVVRGCRRSAAATAALTLDSLLGISGLRKGRDALCSMTSRWPHGGRHCGATLGFSCLSLCLGVWGWPPQHLSMETHKSRWNKWCFFARSVGDRHRRLAPTETDTSPGSRAGDPVGCDSSLQGTGHRMRFRPATDRGARSKRTGRARRKCEGGNHQDEQQVDVPVRRGGIDLDPDRAVAARGGGALARRRVHQPPPPLLARGDRRGRRDRQRPRPDAADDRGEGAGARDAALPGGAPRRGPAGRHAGLVGVASLVLGDAPGGHQQM